MDWYSTIFELVDMRSFSTLWYWIALAGLWSMAIQYVLGVPWDLVLRAGKHDPAMQDMNNMVHISARRILHIAQESGTVLTVILSFLLTAALLLGWVYGRELAQALFLLGMPMAVVWLLSLRAARQIAAANLTGAPLISLLVRHRLHVQIIGMLSIFVTAVWGMYHNMSVSVLWG